MEGRKMLKGPVINARMDLEFMRQYLFHIQNGKCKRL